MMHLRARILIAVLISGVLLAGCASPNAYKKKPGYIGYGYAGEFEEYIPNSNVGYALFSGDQKIPRELLRNQCLRRAAELCAKKGYDYFIITEADNYTGRAKKKVSQYAGTGRDIHGKYYRYKVWEKEVPTKSRRIDFQAFRGPMPPPDKKQRYRKCFSVAEILRQYHGSSYDGKSLTEPKPIKCNSCGKVTKEPKIPEHCNSCGRYMLRSLICPFCHKEVEPAKQGKIKCNHCSKVFRFACCTKCGLEHTLRKFRPFKCSSCKHLSESGIESGKEDFYCPHCRIRMKWPEKKYGEYNCSKCKKKLIVHQCPGCTVPHALQVPKSFTCWGCGDWVRFAQKKEKKLKCPHCGVNRTWPKGESAVGLCLSQGKKVYLTHCILCDAWLARAKTGDFFCKKCGTWTATFFCTHCRKSQRADPNNPPSRCSSCSNDFQKNTTE